MCLQEKVLASQFDATLGGRSWDELVAEQIASQYQGKFGQIKNNPRVWHRLLAACEKQVKRVISSGNSKALLSVDNLANDCDLNAPFTKYTVPLVYLVKYSSREQFDQLTTPLLDRLASLIQSTLDQAGLFL